MTYKRYSDFIPDSYIEYREDAKLNSENRGIKLLVLLALLALPITINTIDKINENNKEDKVVVEYKEELDNSDSLLKWVDFIENSNFNIDILDKRGVIKLKSVDEIRSIEEGDSFQIYSMKRENDFYNIEVIIR